MDLDFRTELETRGWTARRNATGRLGQRENDAADTSSPQSKQLIDVLDNYAIFNSFCSHPEIADILPLKRVTKRWSGHIEAHLKQRWNINKKFERFVKNPQALRTELARYDALISGGFAVQFFDGVVWNELDLDIYAVYRNEDDQIGKHLMKNEEYKLKSKASLTDKHAADLIKVSIARHSFINISDNSP